MKYLVTLLFSLLVFSLSIFVLIGCGEDEEDDRNDVRHSDYTCIQHDGLLTYGTFRACAASPRSRRKC